MKNSDDLDRDLREEIETHMRMRAEHDRTNATDARKRFGNQLRIQEEMRAMHVSVWIDEAVQDLRQAWRRALRHPGFTFAVIAAIAIGIGATASVFSVVDRILFRPLPYANEEQLVWIGMNAPIVGDTFLLAGDYYDWKERQTVFTQITAMRGVEECDATEDNPVRFQCLVASHDYLETFGMTPALGRSFGRGEEDSVLISHALWRQRYSGSGDVLGKTIALNGRTWRIVGVLPSNFEVPSLMPVDIMRPLGLDEKSERGRQRAMTFLRAFARLKPGITVQRAEQAMQPVMQESMRFVPKSFVKEVKLVVQSFREYQTRQTRRISLVLLAAVFSVLLIACANVANLMLARASASERETAIREAIGASKWRLIRQNITESLLLAIVGGIAGIGLAAVLLRVAVTMAPSAIPRLKEASLDGRILGLSLLLTLACGLLTGAVVAIRSRTRGLEPLTGGRVTTHSHRFARPALVTLQISLASALLYSATLLSDSLLRMQQEPLGFESTNVLTTTIQLRDSVYAKPPAREAFWEQLEPRLAQFPGVSAVSLSDSMPPMGRAMIRIFSRIEIDGKPENIRAGTGGMVVTREVTPGYFAALGIRMLHGRTLAEDDRDSPTPVMVLSERLAQKLFGSAPAAMGHLVRPGADVPWSTVVGVAAEVRNAGFDAGDPELYTPLSRKTQRGGLALMVRSNGNLTALQQWIRSEIAAVDPHIPLAFETMEQKTGMLTAGARFNTAVLALFSLAGVALGATGIFSVVSFLVTRRTREIGVRVALGATASNIRGMVLRTSLLWAVLGCAAGAALIAAVLPQLRDLTYQSKLASPWAAGGVLLAMSAVAILASLAPAIRAARLDPVRTLRED